jgi:hypothetical protein
MMYNQAKTWRVLPSQLLFMDPDDAIAAYSFNTAVWLFGTALENELNRNPKPTRDERKEEQRRTRILNKWLRDPEPEEPKAPGAPEESKPVAPARRFAEPRPTR